MLSYVLLAATQLCEVAESMLRQHNFPETGVCRKLAQSLHSLGAAIDASDRRAAPNIEALSARCLKAGDDLLDTLD